MALQINIGLLLLLSASLQTQAYDRCNLLEDDEFVCYDTSVSTAYCCNYYDLDYHSCCYFDNVWTLWYFWFGIIFGIFFLAAVIGGACCYCKKSNQTRTTRPVHVATVAQQQIPISEIDQPFQQKLADAPPCYNNAMMTQQSLAQQPYMGNPQGETNQPNFYLSSVSTGLPQPQPYIYQAPPPLPMGSQAETSNTGSPAGS